MTQETKKKGNWLNLKIGDKIKIGEKSALTTGIKSGKIIKLIKGYFNFENGLYCETQIAPAVKSKEYPGEYESIFHLFGNDLEEFLDSEIID